MGIVGAGGGDNLTGGVQLQASLPCHGLKLFSVCMGIAGSSLTATQMSWILPEALPASVSPEGARAYLQTHSLV